MKLNWDAGHGPITGPLNCGVTALTVGWAGHAAGMPPGWAALAAGAGMAGTHIAGLRGHVTRATLGLRAAAWLGAGAWCSWAVACSPWSAGGLVSLASLTLGLSTAMAGVKVSNNNAEKGTSSKWRTGLAAEWETRLKEVCPQLKVEVVGVQKWESGAGYTLDGECGGSTKWRDFSSYQDSLAANAKLPEGCGVIVKSGAHRGAVLFDVSTANALKNDVPYPEDYSPLSINGPSPLGLYRDSSLAAPVMRQRSALIVGRVQSGKTNLLHVQLANQARMTDNLTWVIDLNGGGLALPWLRAWHAAGRPGKPPIDWVADTPEKALAMAEAALRIAKARKPGYVQRQIDANDDKLPVGPDVPAIFLINDEIAELFSPRAQRDPVLKKTADAIVQVMELARAVAVRVINAALRATQDVVSEPQLLKQAGLRIGMRSSATEMSYLFGWDDRTSPEEAPYPGSGFIKLDEDQAAPFKVYRLRPDQIADVVKATADRHPELDELSRQAAGDAYTNRWDGTDHLFEDQDGTARLPQPTAPTPPRPGVTDGWGKPGAVARDEGVRAALNDADAVRDRLHEALEETSANDPDLERKFQEILAEGGAVWQAPPSVEGDPRRELIFGIVAQSGPGGIGPAAILGIVKRLHPEVRAPHPDVIARWLNADIRVYKPRNGRYAVRPGMEE